MDQVSLRTGFVPTKANVDGRRRSDGDLHRGRLRILVHDYSGHPFQVELSRELARRGHEVLHLHSAAYVTGKGAVDRKAGDPDTFNVRAVELGRQFGKYSAWRRPLHETLYARALIPHLERFAPSVVVSANTPLFAQRLVMPACKRLGVAFVFWQQDIYSLAMKRIAEQRLGAVGSALGRAFVSLERSLLHRSDAIVSISEDFGPVLEEWGLPRDKLHIVENWAPLAELPVRPKDNAWAREHELADKKVFLYSGTLGLKHNPDLLLQLALAFRTRPDVRVVVISEGLGADQLARGVAEHDLDNVTLLGFQPYDRLADVLATGDVLVTILERDAGAFSVPSKVLTYHCAGRPLLAAIPSANLGARIIVGNDAGVVVDPDGSRQFVDAARTLVDDAELRQRMGRNARSYAERTFEIRAIGDRFETILTDAARVHFRARAGGLRVPTDEAAHEK